MFVYHFQNIKQKMIFFTFLSFVFLLISPASSMPPNEIQFTKRAPSSFLPTNSNQQKLELLDFNKIPIFGNLPKPILRTIFILYLKGDTEQIIRVLKASAKLDETYRLQKCQLLFSTPLCLNSSANPFYFWVKYTVDKMLNKSRTHV